MAKKSSEEMSVHKAAKSEYDRAYRQKMRERRREHARKHDTKRRATVRGKLDDRIASLIYHDLKKGKNRRAWESLVGYTLEQLHGHIEKLFKDGMTWEHYMRGEVQIDHIIPRAAFVYTSPDDAQFKECWALTNLQPLWRLHNASKGSLMPDGTRARRVYVLQSAA